MPFFAQIGNIGPFSINSVSWGVQHVVNLPAGGSAGPTQAQVSDIVITKNVDGNSAVLLQASAAGTAFDSASFTTVAYDGTQTTYTLSSVIIASYSISSGDSPTETMDWNCAQMSNSGGS